MKLVYIIFIIIWNSVIIIFFQLALSQEDLEQAELSRNRYQEKLQEARQTIDSLTNELKYVCQTENKLIF